jgi:GMP synthase (glutamine-hydrolysing)
MNVNKPVLIIQLRPEDNTSDNEYQAMLKYGDLIEEQTHRLRIENSGIPENLSIDDYSAIIVGGSPFDISTPNDKKSAIQHKIEADFKHLLNQVIKHDFPFLGACSGNGLLGSYLGTSISQRYREPVSCVTLDITEQGKHDPLLKGFPDQIEVMLGHKEACDTVPQGAILLMRGTRCPVQMFRVANNIYATQFHPEGDAEGFILRIEAYKHNGYFKLHEVEELTQKLSQASTPYAQQILKRFVQRYYKHADIELQLLDWADAKPLAAQIRRTVFIEEQQVPESEEWDDEDEPALHIIAIKDGEAIATARLTQEGKIGRMAVLKQHRQQGIASMMLLSLIEAAKQQGQQEIKLWSQTHAQAFYQKHGFVVYGEEFLDAGIPHIEMRLKTD